MSAGFEARKRPKIVLVLVVVLMLENGRSSQQYGIRKIASIRLEKNAAQLATQAAPHVFEYDGEFRSTSR